MQLDPEAMDAVTKRLKRAHGQLAGVLRMIESGRDVEDIVIQLAAVSKAIDRAGYNTITLAMRQVLANPTDPVDQQKLEKLFLSMA